MAQTSKRKLEKGQCHESQGIQGNQIFWIELRLIKPQILIRIKKLIIRRIREKDPRDSSKILNKNN